MLKRDEEIYMLAIAKAARRRINGKSIFEMSTEAGLSPSTGSGILNGKKHLYIISVAKFLEGNKINSSEFFSEVESYLPEGFSLLED